MHITVNNQGQELPEPCTVEDLVAQLQLGGRRVALERNGEILPRSKYRETALAPGDRIEIVHAIGGG